MDSLSATIAYLQFEFQKAVDSKNLFGPKGQKITDVHIYRSSHHNGFDLFLSSKNREWTYTYMLSYFDLENPDQLNKKITGIIDSLEKKFKHYGSPLYQSLIKEAK